MSAVESYLKAEILFSKNQKDLKRAAEIVLDGGVIAFPFNGIFGLFGNIDNPKIAEEIIRVKNRPANRKLIAVALPEHADELVNFSKSYYSLEALRELWTDTDSVHALGMILPASLGTPKHLRQLAETGEETRGKITPCPYHPVFQFREFMVYWKERVSQRDIRCEEDLGTVLIIWTEYPPLRFAIEHFRELGGRAWVGTSANKNGQPTHCSFPELEAEFRHDIAALVEDDFSRLPKERRKSTSVIDLTENPPRFHRAGNVSEEELVIALSKHRFPELTVGRDVVTVRSRTS